MIDPNTDEQVSVKDIIEGLRLTREAILYSHDDNWKSGSKKIFHMHMIDLAIQYIRSQEKEEKKDG